MLAIVPFSAADFPALSGTGYESMSAAARRTMLAASERKTHEDGCYFEIFTIKDGGTVVGFASLYAKKKGVVSIGLDIREPFRRRGYATRAAEPLTALLTGKGFVAIRTHVRTDNEASIRLHEKLGFTRTGQEKTDRGTAVFVYEKQLRRYDETLDFFGKTRHTDMKARTCVQSAK